MSSLARKMRRNKAKKEYKANKNLSNDMEFSDYWKVKEGKPVNPKKRKKFVQQGVPVPEEIENEQEKKRKESIETGKTFLKGLDIFNKKVEDIKAHDEHGEHN